MKNIPLFPRPVSWLSAGLLYVFLGLWMTFVVNVLPRLYEVWETYPRLVALGFLGVWISPVAFVGILHHVIHAFLDRAESKGARGLFPGLGSLWAGVFSWLVIMFTSSVVLLLLLVLYPPPPADQLLTMFAWPFDGRARAGIHTLAWVVIAAQLYDLERAMKERHKRGEL